jgi:hypothetical protein
MFRGKFMPDGTPAKARAPNAFASFVKEQFAGVKAAHPAGAPRRPATMLQQTGDVMATRMHG